MANNEYTIIELNNETIKSMIYVVRGQKVMLDFNLAKIYGYETKNFNRQISNNMERFDKEFRFQISKEEFNIILRCKNFTSSWGGIRYLPYAFTEQGIYMLMTVLKGDLAVRQSIALIKAFKQMKDYLIENKGLLTTNETIKLTNLVNEHSNRLDIIEEKLEVVMDSFDDPSKCKHYLIRNGEKLEADVAYQEIYKLAKKSIYIIDDYISVKTLQLLKCCKQEVKIIIITDNKAKNGISQSFINDFINDTGYDLVVKPSYDRFHDRYIVIDYNTYDEVLYHCGASSKDAGGRITTINIIEEINLYKSLIDELLGDKNE